MAHVAQLHDNPMIPYSDSSAFLRDLYCALEWAYHCNERFCQDPVQ